jgi:transposase
LFTKNGKALAASGVKPICPFHQVFQSLYLFGAFSPITGDHFLLEMPHCNGETFQIFLNEFSLHNPEELKIIILDNGAFHKGKKLIMPENVILIFLPPYSPELNPAEKVWAKFKRDFSNRLFKSLNDLDKYICTIVKMLTNTQVINICSYDYIFLNNFWTKL